MADPIPPTKTEPTPPWTAGRIRDTRDNVLSQIAASGLTAAQKALLIEEINLVPAGFNLIQVDFHRTPYKAGGNTAFTVSEL